MISYFPKIAGSFKFIDDRTGKTFPPSTIVRKYKKKYDSMTPEAFEKWLYTEHNLRVFFARNLWTNIGGIGYEERSSDFY